MAKGDPRMTRSLEILFGRLMQPGVIGSAVTVTPNLTYDIALEATNDTTITVKMMGQDGVIRSTTLTLA